MKKSIFPKIFVFLLIIVIIIETIYFNNILNSLKKELYIKETALNNTLINLNKIKNENILLQQKLERNKEEMKYLKNVVYNLNISYNKLLSDYENLKINYINLNKSYNFILEKYASLYEKYKELNKTLISINYTLNSYNLTKKLKNLQLSFLKENVYYPLYKYDFFEEIKASCISNNILDLPCAIIIILRNRYNFKYISDKGDLIENTKDFITHKGGDCEDWSLFIWSLLQNFRNEGIEEIKLGYPTEGSKMFLGKTNYYINNYEPYIVNLSKYKINLYCYHLNYTTGHCILALSPKYLTPFNLNNTKILFIEPQEGIIYPNLNLSKVMLLGNLKYGFFVKIWSFWV